MRATKFLNIFLLHLYKTYKLSIAFYHHNHTITPSFNIIARFHNHLDQGDGYQVLMENGSLEGSGEEMIANTTLVNMKNASCYSQKVHRKWNASVRQIKPRAPQTIFSFFPNTQTEKSLLKEL